MSAPPVVPCPPVVYGDAYAVGVVTLDVPSAAPTARAGLGYAKKPLAVVRELDVASDGSTTTVAAWALTADDWAALPLVLGVAATLHIDVEVTPASGALPRTLVRFAIPVSSDRLGPVSGPPPAGPAAVP